MRIDDHNLPAAGPAGAQGTQASQGTRSAQQIAPGGGSAASGAPPVSGGDRIQLSTLAERLQALQPGSEARQAELARLREMVETGSYRVDAERVSEALLEEALRETPLERDREPSSARRE